MKLFSTLRKLAFVVMAISIVAQGELQAKTRGNEVTTPVPTSSLNFQAVVAKTVNEKVFRLAFSVTKTQPVTISIRNNDKEAVFRQTYRNKKQFVENFDLSKLPAGTYSVEFTTGLQKLTQYVTIGG